MNYIEGLEWVYKYYSKDCVDWLWRYRYEKGPLMKDIVKKIGLVLLKKDVEERLNEKEQMMYVLPNENLYLLGEKGEEIKEKYKELYPKHYEFKWGYCRYFWEAHPKLPEITIEMLKKM